mgnify:CR=1 FL=1
MAIGLFAQIGLLAHLLVLLAPVLGAQAAGWAMSLATACAIVGRRVVARAMPAGANRRTAAAVAFDCAPMLKGGDTPNMDNTRTSLWEAGEVLEPLRGLKSELLHERKRWYDRLVASGKLEQHRVRDEWERWKGIARFFGYFFFGLGLVLLVLIVYAMVSRLAH